ncbi:lantibiotic dehydratase [Streptomyces sp. NPDC048606]|uniref:lantibiotic dehydratase n=1 Tax=Streptomyces sp. NPDC048606 TaxID=3154726 RepID=UPI003446A7DA
MPQPQPSTVADVDTVAAVDGYHVRSAPHALIRFTVLAHPAQGRAAADFRTLLTRLSGLDTALARITGPLGDHLHDSYAGHPETYHRDVVLPLRRALHNGREPRPALLERLDDLPDRIPLLASWLALRTRRSALLARLPDAAEAALADERDALAALCRDPALGKAVALTSGDLLRAVERAATGPVDRRTRKEEPTVLRYALRASTKTSPLSWFTAVGWGTLTREPAAPVPSWGAPELHDGPLRSIVKVNRTLTTALVLALRDAPHRLATTPHRITSTARIADGRATYSRDRTSFSGGRYLVADEDEVALPYGGPLRLLTEHLADTPLHLPELTGLLTAALSAAGHGAHDAAEAFLDRLREAGLLVPGDPLPPLASDPVGGIAAWLRRIAAPRPEEAVPVHITGVVATRADEVTRVADAARAERIAELGRLTATFADAPAANRPALLAGLSRSWKETLADAGRPVPETAAPLTVLSEDVVTPHPLHLDGFLDSADREALGEVTALAELFDLGHLVRRILRDRFVARYGHGGRTGHPWEFGAEVVEAWQTAGSLADLNPSDRADLPTGTEELALLRQEFARAAQAAADDQRGATEVVLPPELVRSLGPRLPGWALERPLSYSYFLQKAPTPGRDLLCVNHVYGGWGRFSSRFLDTLDPRAGAGVSEQIRQGLGPGARAAQIRPVGGFNANLHPLFVPDEIGPDRRWASIGEGDLDLVHDEATDQVRLSLRSTGELLDVLYAGFLAPVLLPRRIGAHLADHPHGVVDFLPLVPRRALDAPGGRVLIAPRLSHRHVVLRRRRWTLSPGVVARLRADLATGGPVPAEAVARWRALLDLPEQLFLHPVAATSVGRPAEDFLRSIDRPKPHFVDLGNALHLRCLHKWLARHGDGAVFEEALPAPGGLTEPTRATELVLEVYRAGRRSR